jgi:hypothetical protein
MTITRSLRPFAAAALAAGLVLPAAASAAGRSTGTGHGNVSHASSHSSYQRHKVEGLLQTMSGTTTPATLTVQMARGTTITVIVSARTTLLRGHGGRSGLAELTVGDRLTADGSFATGRTTTFAARRLTDVSLAYSHVVGSVAGVWSGGVTLSLARRGSPHSPYWHADVVSVSLSPSTQIISGSVALAASAMTWTQPPALHVQVAGLYDTANHALPTLRADRVRILGTSGRPEPVATATPTPSSSSPPRHRGVAALSGHAPGGHPVAWAARASRIAPLSKGGSSPAVGPRKRHGVDVAAGTSPAAHFL